MRTDLDSPAYLAPLGRMLSATGRHLPDLVEVYCTGGGVSWAEMGVDARESQGDMSRPWYQHELHGARAYVTDLHDLLSRPGTRTADVGCGVGGSSIAPGRLWSEPDGGVMRRG